MCCQPRLEGMGGLSAEVNLGDVRTRCPYDSADRAQVMNENPNTHTHTHTRARARTHARTHSVS